jgi:predicted RNase H-like HicB family nuclease
LQKESENSKIKIMKYQVLIHKSEYGFDAHVPSLPGCHSQGETEKEALENVKDAIKTYIEIEAEELKGAELREVEVFA